MYRRISTADIRIGMYVHSLDGSWFDHGFWRTRFEVTNPDQVAQISASGIAFVTIDETRGLALGVQDQESAAGQLAITAAIDDRSAVVEPQSATRRTVQPMPEKMRLSSVERKVEVRKANAALKKSKTAVMSMFEQARLGKAVNANRMLPLVEQISQTINRDASIILNVARLKNKDEYTYLHSVAVCALMMNLGRKLNLGEAEIENLGMAGMLHDIGKMGVPDDILLKPGKLTDEEFSTIKTHPQWGHKVLSSSKNMSETTLDVCLHHHEKMDGSGYPHRLPGEAISLEARMSAVCDVYDAITSQRPYNRPFSPSEALARMQSWDGHFDKLILNAFVDSLGITPVGSLVRLNTGKLGVVFGEAAHDYTLPRVRTFFDIDRNRQLQPSDVVTGHDANSVRVNAIEDPADWGITDWATQSRALLAQTIH